MDNRHDKIKISARRLRPTSRTSVKMILLFLLIWVSHCEPLQLFLRVLVERECRGGKLFCTHRTGWVSLQHLLKWRKESREGAVGTLSPLFQDHVTTAGYTVRDDA